MPSAEQREVAGGRPLDILLVINGTDFGGTESALAGIALQLSKGGHRVVVLSMKRPGRTGERMKLDGTVVDSLKMDEVVNPVNLVTATLRLAGWLNRHPVDVVHSFLPRANIASRIANRLARGRRAHLSAERSTDFNRSLMTCRLNRWTARWTDRVLAISEHVKEVLKRRDRLRAETIHIVENGIDTERVDRFPKTEIRRELGLTDDDLVFCTVGRLIPDKGYVYLVEALARMREPAHLILVGEGPEEERIRAEARRRDLSSRVHMLGFRDDVLGVMKDVDLFVLSSLEEGMPVVLVEAMAAGLPIVSTRVGGIADLVVEGETALLVTPAERWQEPGQERCSEEFREIGVSSLVAGLDEMAADAEQRSVMGEAGRRRIAEIFSLERIVERLETHYREVLRDAQP